jgi:hypothetical protein
MNSTPMAPGRPWAAWPKIDVPPTWKLNQQRGGRFSLPSGSGEILIRFYTNFSTRPLGLMPEILIHNQPGDERGHFSPARCKQLLILPVRAVVRLA